MNKKGYSILLLKLISLIIFLYYTKPNDVALNNSLKKKLLAQVSSSQISPNRIVAILEEAESSDQTCENKMDHRQSSLAPIGKIVWHVGLSLISNPSNEVDTVIQQSKGKGKEKQSACDGNNENREGISMYYANYSIDASTFTNKITTRHGNTTNKLLYNIHEGVDQHIYYGFGGIWVPQMFWTKLPGLLVIFHSAASLFFDTSNVQDHFYFFCWTMFSYLLFTGELVSLVGTGKTSAMILSLEAITFIAMRIVLPLFKVEKSIFNYHILIANTIATAAMVTLILKSKDYSIAWYQYEVKYALLAVIHLSIHQLTKDRTLLFGIIVGFLMPFLYKIG